MLTLKGTREQGIHLLTLRSQIRTLTETADAITAALRPALAHWGPVATSDDTTIYVAASGERRTLDSERICNLARSLGATDDQILGCYKITTTAAPVKSRTRKASDR